STVRLRWQSQLPLFLIVALGTAGIALQCIALSSTSAPRIVQAFGLGAFLAVLTWHLRAATGTAAVTGGLCATALSFATPGWRTSLWPLLALLLLTLAATRFGRARKEKLGVAEGRHGRTASQVAANLGVAVLASIPLGFSHFFVVTHILNPDAMQLALVAALAEAAADTLSSELGEVFGGEPRLLTNLRPVPAGTDGAVSLAGTLAGCSGAAVVTAVASLALRLTPAEAALVAFAAIAGFLVDSLLGATFERRGWLNNDAVNFLSTLAAAILAAALSRPS
ncbi:MAG: DUF92 domain-containing protein, partial [Silvibacterium sp.]